VNAAFRHWSADPFDLLVLLVVTVHLRGLLVRLRAIRRAGRPTTPWIQQAALFYCGLAVLIIAVTSPIDYWSDSYLSLHIIQHLLLAFIAPPLIVLGAPWLPLLRGLPSPLRRAIGRAMQLTRSGRPGTPGTTARLFTGARRLLSRPITSVVLFNATMVLWHFPALYDLALENQTIHIWLEHSSFFLFGIALWLQVFGSYPLRPILDGPRRVVVLIATNAVMVVVAMTLVMFTKAIYPAYAAVHTVSLRAADQQIGGAILWVCGEVIFLPAILFTVAQWLDTGSGASPPGMPQSAAKWQPAPSP
jgi:putative membrane protein